MINILPLIIFLKSQITPGERDIFLFFSTGAFGLLANFPRLHFKQSEFYIHSPVWLMLWNSPFQLGMAEHLLITV